MHGGFRCGKDSKWNKTDCIPVYCDSGYFYNKISNSCIKYPIEKEDHNETDSDNTDEGDDKSPKDNKTLIIIEYNYFPQLGSQPTDSFAYR